MRLTKHSSAGGKSMTTYELTPSSTTEAEGGTITFTVTRSGSLPAETLYASTLFDSASSGAGDYDGFEDQAVVFSSGEDTETFTVHLNTDSLNNEGTEHFRVMIAQQQGAG